MAEVFDLMKLKSYPYSQKAKNVFFQRPEFKARIIDLAAGEHIPDCQMESHVIFVCLSGQATVAIEGQEEQISKGKCLVSEPGKFSMTSVNGARLLGIQIKPLR